MAAYFGRSLIKRNLSLHTLLPHGFVTDSRRTCERVFHALGCLSIADGPDVDAEHLASGSEL